MARSKSRLQARVLRKQGLGIKTIAHQLGASSSSVSLWCRDIELSEDQLKVLSQRAHDPYYGRRREYIESQREKKQAKIQKFLQEGIKRVKYMDADQLFYAGIALYWAEGFKKDNLAGFTNSDPAMIRFFIRWLEECCGISRERLKFRLGLNEQYEDSVDKIEYYWSKYLGISKVRFQKPFFQKVKWQKEYENKENYHGVLRVRIAKSTDFLRLVLGWIEGLKSIENFGNRP